MLSSDRKNRAVGLARTGCRVGLTNQSFSFKGKELTDRLGLIGLIYRLSGHNFSSPILPSKKQQTLLNNRAVMATNQAKDEQNLHFWIH